MTKIYMIAGEVSGDFIASSIMKVLRADTGHYGNQTAHAELVSASHESDTSHAESVSASPEILNQVQDDVYNGVRDDIDTTHGNTRHPEPVSGSKEALPNIQEMLKKVQHDGDDLEFVGIGGILMAEQGLNSLFPIEEISLMGFAEILPHIFRLRKLINKTARDVIEQNPDILVTIDSPGFTSRVVKQIRKLAPKADFKIMHIVAPSVWAYRPSRAKKYAELYDHLLTILPFEAPYFTKYNLPCTYIGHPFLEQNFSHDIGTIRNEWGISSDTKTVCVTAGSRENEIAVLMPIFCGALNILAKDYKYLEVIFVLANTKHQELIESFLGNATFKYRYSTERLKSFAISTAAIAKSGTNVLEILACYTPVVVAYKVNPLSFRLIKRLIKVKYASLVNIIEDRELIPEFIQDDCTPEKIAAGINRILSVDGVGINQVGYSHVALRQLGLGSKQKPSELAAKAIIDNLRK